MRTWSFLAASVAVLLAACSPSEPQSTGGPAVLRRLTQEQYQNIVADVFGSDIIVGGRFDPLERHNGLLAVGAGKTTMTVTALDGYDAIARSVAAQVVDATHRTWLVPCVPASLQAADEACTRKFFTSIGRLLYRRALTGDELKAQVAIASDATARLGTFYDGLGSALAAMLTAPEFLFVQDHTQEAPATTVAQLTAYAKASRLSFFLWNSAPDDALLKAAESADLNSASGLKRQVDRMLASPKLERGVRGFFSDMYGFDGFDTLQKDSVIYPAFGLATVQDAREQALRTIVDHLVNQDADYRDLFTTRTTFVTRSLGMIYRVGVQDPEAWIRHEFPAGDPHVGIQSQPAFVALYSHPGRSSATIRGKAIRELLMCQKVPDPPANVDFTLVSDSQNPVYKTARQRLSAHSTDPSCAGCHRIMDPIGLALENFDGAGQWRSAENGEKIDTSGELDGLTYADAAGLGKALHDSPAIPSCLVERAVSYATGRAAVTGERAWVTSLAKGFAEDKYRLRSLMRRIALADAFYLVSPDAAAPAQKTTSR